MNIFNQCRRTFFGKYFQQICYGEITHFTVFLCAFHNVVHTFFKSGFGVIYIHIKVGKEFHFVGCGIDNTWIGSVHILKKMGMLKSFIGVKILPEIKFAFISNKI